MPMTSWICGSVCSRKFFGEPPPRMNTDDMQPVDFVSWTVEAVVQIVIQVCSGGDDPIDEAGFHERDEARFAEARRRERAGEAHPDEAVVGQHFFDEQSGRFTETPAVVSQETLVDEIGGGNVLAHAGRVKARIVRKPFGKRAFRLLAHKSAASVAKSD